MGILRHPWSWKREIFAWLGCIILIWFAGRVGLLRFDQLAAGCVCCSGCVFFCCVIEVGVSLFWVGV